MLAHAHICLKHVTGHLLEAQVKFGVTFRPCDVINCRVYGVCLLRVRESKLHCCNIAKHDHANVSSYMKEERLSNEPFKIGQPYVVRRYIASPHAECLDFHSEE